jgi:transcription initiation factor TFIIIB Brf1 subunit/transcription initiation factor TFIIB
MIRSIEQIKECPDCASSNIVHNIEREQVICRECGLIYEPLTPAEEETYEKAHDLTMRGISMARPAVKANAKKIAKAKPAKKRKK